MSSLCKAIIIVVFLPTITLVLLSWILYSSILLYRSRPYTNVTSLSVAPQFPAKVGCYNSYTTKRVIVSSTDDQEFSPNVRFYRNNYEANRSYVVETPQVELPFISPIADSNVGFNYYSGDNPVYTAGANGYIMYNISASFSSNDVSLASSSQCLMQLHVFNSKDKYLAFTESTFFPEGNYFIKSGCLPVGKDDEIENSTVTFALPEAGSYFVAISLKAGVVVLGGSVAVQAIEYNVTGLDILQCSLNSFVDQCTFNFESKFQIIPKQKQVVCIWAESESVSTVNISSSSNKNLAISYSILLSASCLVLIVFLLSFTITVCVCYFKTHRQERLEISEVEPLLKKRDKIHDFKNNHNIQSP